VKPARSFVILVGNSGDPDDAEPLKQLLTGQDFRLLLIAGPSSARSAG